MKVVIIGGGSSGWLMATALSYVKKTNPTKVIDVTLIESPKVDRLSVGESTFPSLATLINAIGIDENDILNKSNGTYKWGTQFVGFQEYDYYHPVFGLPFVEDELTMDEVFIANDERVDISAIGTQMMLSREKPIKKFVEQTFTTDVQWNYPSRVGPYALHIDINKFIDYIADFCVEKYGIKVVENQVVDVKKDIVGNCQEVVCEDGSRISGDVFIDCSGFSRVLFEKILKEKFVSFKDFLPVDSAIAFEKVGEKYEPLRKNFVTATAFNSGWSWEIPLRNKTSRGYVYSSDFITADDAVLELESRFGKIDITSKIDMKTGMFERLGIKNMYAVGLASGFIEPLESNATTITTGQANYLAGLLSNSNDTNLISELYNTHCGKTFSHFLSFIQLHYINNRGTTDFWKHAKRNIRYAEVFDNFMEDIYQNKRLPTGKDMFIDDLEENFGLSSWLSVMQSIKFIDKSHCTEAHRSVDFELAKKTIDEEIRYYKNLLRDNTYE